MQNRLASSADRHSEQNLHPKGGSTELRRPSQVHLSKLKSMTTIRTSVQALTKQKTSTFNQETSAQQPKTAHSNFTKVLSRSLTRVRSSKESQLFHKSPQATKREDSFSLQSSLPGQGDMVRVNTVTIRPEVTVLFSPQATSPQSTPKKQSRKAFSYQQQVSLTPKVKSDLRTRFNEETPDFPLHNLKQVGGFSSAARHLRTKTVVFEKQNFLQGMSISSDKRGPAIQAKKSSTLRTPAGGFNPKFQQQTTQRSTKTSSLGGSGGHFYHNFRKYGGADFAFAQLRNRALMRTLLRIDKRFRRKVKRYNHETYTKYKVRNDIVEGAKGAMRSPAFTAPMVDYDSDGYYSDQEDYGDLKKYPVIVKAKRCWRKLYQVIMDVRADIPLKQMALKAKHEDQIFKQIMHNFARGKSISELREKLENLDENMRFKGGPKDRQYRRAFYVAQKKPHFNDLAAYVEDKMLKGGHQQARKMTVTSVLKKRKESTLSVQFALKQQTGDENQEACSQPGDSHQSGELKTNRQRSLKSVMSREGSETALMRQLSFDKIEELDEDSQVSESKEQKSPDSPTRKRRRMLKAQGKSPRKPLALATQVSTQSGREQRPNMNSSIGLDRRLSKRSSVQMKEQESTSSLTESEITSSDFESEKLSSSENADKMDDSIRESRQESKLARAKSKILNQKSLTIIDSVLSQSDGYSSTRMMPKRKSVRAIKRRPTFSAQLGRMMTKYQKGLISTAIKSNREMVELRTQHKKDQFKTKLKSLDSFNFEDKPEEQSEAKLEALLEQKNREVKEMVSKVKIAPRRLMTSGANYLSNLLTQTKQVVQENSAAKELSGAHISNRLSTIRSRKQGQNDESQFTDMSRPPSQLSSSRNLPKKSGDHSVKALVRKETGKSSIGQPQSGDLSRARGVMLPKRSSKSLSKGTFKLAPQSKAVSSKALLRQNRLQLFGRKESMKEVMQVTETSEGQQQTPTMEGKSRSNLMSLNYFAPILELDSRMTIPELSSTVTKDQERDASSLATPILKECERAPSLPSSLVTVSHKASLSSDSLPSVRLTESQSVSISASQSSVQEKKDTSPSDKGCFKPLADVIQEETSENFSKTQNNPVLTNKRHTDYCGSNLTLSDEYTPAKLKRANLGSKESEIKGFAKLVKPGYHRLSGMLEPQASVTDAAQTLLSIRKFVTKQRTALTFDKKSVESPTHIRTNFDPLRNSPSLKAPDSTPFESALKSSEDKAKEQDRQSKERLMSKSLPLREQSNSSSIEEASLEASLKDTSSSQNSDSSSSSSISAQMSELLVDEPQQVSEEAVVETMFKVELPLPIKPLIEQFKLDKSQTVQITEESSSFTDSNSNTRQTKESKETAQKSLARSGSEPVSPDTKPAAMLASSGSSIEVLKPEVNLFSQSALQNSMGALLNKVKTAGQSSLDATAFSLLKKNPTANNKLNLASNRTVGFNNPASDTSGTDRRLCRSHNNNLARSQVMASTGRNPVTHVDHLRLLRQSQQRAPTLKILKQPRGLDSETNSSSAEATTMIPNFRNAQTTADQYAYSSRQGAGGAKTQRLLSATAASQYTATTSKPNLKRSVDYAALREALKLNQIISPPVSQSIQGPFTHRGRRLFSPNQTMTPASSSLQQAALKAPGSLTQRAQVNRSSFATIQPLSNQRIKEDDELVFSDHCLQQTDLNKMLESISVNPLFKPKAQPAQHSQPSLPQQIVAQPLTPPSYATLSARNTSQQSHAAPNSARVHEARQDLSQPRKPKPKVFTRLRGRLNRVSVNRPTSSYKATSAVLSPATAGQLSGRRNQPTGSYLDRINF